MACSVEDCGNEVRGHGLCNRHYLRWRRRGDPLGGRGPWDAVPVARSDKVCARCGETKPLDLFATRTGARDGKSSWCKACHTAHYHLKAEQRADDRLRWKAENPDYFHQYYVANRSERKAQSKAWYEANRETRLAWWKRFREQNREKLNSMSRDYQRRIGHKYSRARMLAERTRVVEVVDRRVVFERGGGICGICRDPVQLETFHIDHTIPLSKGGEHSYANTQPTHPRCNLRKGARIDAAPSGDVAA